VLGKGSEGKACQAVRSERFAHFSSDLGTAFVQFGKKALKSSFLDIPLVPNALEVMKRRR
jgi:hypothetical protein